MVGASSWRVRRYLRRTLWSLRYDGLLLTTWRAWKKLLWPLGSLNIFLFLVRDLSKPVGEVEARIGVAIVEATREDIPEIAALIRQHHELTPHRREAVAQDLPAKLEGKDRCFIARVGGDLVHYNWVVTNSVDMDIGATYRLGLSSDEAYTGPAYTGERWRGRGIHVAVLNQMMQSLQRDGYRAAYAHVLVENKSAWKGNLRLGWDLCGVLFSFQPRFLNRTWLWVVRGNLTRFLPAPGRFLVLSRHA